MIFQLGKLEVRSGSESGSGSESAQMKSRIRSDMKTMPILHNTDQNEK
jgi:hypothetical protein